jgi:hypothetical protein
MEIERPAAFFRALKTEFFRGGETSGRFAPWLGYRGARRPSRSDQDDLKG